MSGSLIPYKIDCGDIPITPFDAAHAFKQMEQGYRQVLYHPTSEGSSWEHPRIVSLGGDHSIVLPILRSLKHVYGPISVIHLDSHLDTWDPYEGYTGIASNQSAITHGTFFLACQSGGLYCQGHKCAWRSEDEAFREWCFVYDRELILIKDNQQSPKDYEIDQNVGFTIIEAHEIDDIGMSGIIDKVRRVVGDTPTYLSIDIDGKI
jgi:Arginase/agmatinase/formimionoglutamate hydrolase, arginase family